MDTIRGEDILNQGLPRAKFCEWNFSGDASFTFHDFLACHSHQWELKEDGSLDERGSDAKKSWAGANPAENSRRTKFVQRWLFFELLRETFDGLEFHYSDFIDEEWMITGRALGGYCERLRQREVDAARSGDLTQLHEQKSRIIRIRLALYTARGYVVKHCAVTENNQNIRWPIDQDVALSIILLGEYLSRALINIQKACGVTITGWQDSDIDSQGWGYSETVLQKFSLDHWCPKTVRMLKVLMKQSTQGLISAIDNRIDFHPHNYCDEDTCNAPKADLILSNAMKGEDPDEAGRRITEALKTGITPTPLRHEVGCRVRSFRGCKLLGPEEEKLISILEAKDVPLFSYDLGGEVRVHGMSSHTYDKQYIVFSHVWTDGFGNPDANTMTTCVLQFLLESCDRLINDHGRPLQLSGNTNRGTRLFWIDTLALPANPKYGLQRDEAIGQIHQVYRHATATIVLDSGLMKADGGSSTRAAMCLSLSRWMTRLWTLQEAVLSKNIFFNFLRRVYSLEDIERNLKEDRDMRSFAAGTYFSGLLGAERQTIRELDEKRDSTQLVASLWRAVQWRESSISHHETLALAILLNIPLQDFTRLSSPKPPTSEEQESFMEHLLEELSHRSPVAIPAGMIFLPGKKLSKQGFRWAPKTWKTRAEILSPDPLEWHEGQDDTRLDSKGLHVKYPGYRLYGMRNILRTLSESVGFYFPTNIRLNEWIYVKKPSPTEAFPPEEALLDKELAIITMRSPVGNVEQSGLLVAITGKSSNGGLKVERLCRVLLHCERNMHTLKSNFFKEDNLQSRLFGEELPGQLWCVDGPSPTVTQPMESSPLHTTEAPRTEVDESSESVPTVPNGTENDQDTPQVEEEPSLMMRLRAATTFNLSGSSRNHDRKPFLRSHTEVIHNTHEVSDGSDTPKAAGNPGKLARLFEKLRAP